jgi:hypothetical protein
MKTIYLNVTARECSDLMKTFYARNCDPEAEGRRILGDTVYDLMKSYVQRGVEVRFTPWPTKRSGSTVPFKKRFSDTDDRPFRRPR